jgi:hypothetical protein
VSTGDDILHGKRLHRGGRNLLLLEERRDLFLAKRFWSASDFQTSVMR